MMHVPLMEDCFVLLRKLLKQYLEEIESEAEQIREQQAYRKAFSAASDRPECWTDQSRRF